MLSPFDAGLVPPWFGGGVPADPTGCEAPVGGGVPADSDFGVADAADPAEAGGFVDPPDGGGVVLGLLLLDLGGAFLLAGAVVPPAGFGVPADGAGVPACAVLPAAVFDAPTDGAGVPADGAGVSADGAGVPDDGPGVPTAGVTLCCPLDTAGVTPEAPFVGPVPSLSDSPGVSAPGFAKFFLCLTFFG